MNCNPKCPQRAGHGQGRGCECSTNATRAVYAAIWRWMKRNPECIGLFLILVLWTYLTVVGAA